MIDRTSEATGFCKHVINNIKAQEDVENWKYEDGNTIRSDRDYQVPEKYAGLIRHVVREIILEKVQLPTID